MLAIDLFKHAFKMLFYDVWATIRLTLFPVAIACVLAVVMAFTGGLDSMLILAGELKYQEVGFASIVQSLVFLFVFILILCWAAVGWHRFVLLNERPGVLLPKMNKQYVLAYLWAGLKYATVSIGIVVASIVPPALIMSMVAGLKPLVAIAFLVVLLFVKVALFRLALILPAAAVGQQVSMKQSWRATDGYSWALLGIMFMSGILNKLVDIDLGDGAIAIVFLVVFNWLNIAVGISILTTLYGYCIEMRELE